MVIKKQRKKKLANVRLIKCGFLYECTCLPISFEIIEFTDKSINLCVCVYLMEGERATNQTIEG